MHSLYTLDVTIHILAAFLWLGGMFFLAVVGAPVLRRLGSPELRSQLWRDLGEGFGRVGWACIVVLLVTGMLNLWYAGVLSREVLTSSALWSTPYGRALAGTLTAVAAMVVVSAIHDFVLGPRASRLTPGHAEAATARPRAALLARVNALLGVAAVWAAVAGSRVRFRDLPGMAADLLRIFRGYRGARRAWPALPGSDRGPHGGT